MQSTAIKLNSLLENLEEEDYNKAVSYIEFLVTRRTGQTPDKKTAEDGADVETIVSSLIGAIPDMGKSLEEYRNERLKKEDMIKNALELPWKDFEDSVQYSVALLQEMDGIVTRNPNDYKKAEIEIWTPEELLL